MKKKIGIATVSTGYNYGSALQAYATGMILRSCGYEHQLLRIRGSLIKGRDVRLRKLISITKTIIFDPIKFVRFFKIYSPGSNRKLVPGSKELFDSFNKKYLKPNAFSWSELKRVGHSEEYEAFICGSDQIWNAETYYVDPFYYLDFSAPNKRIAFAPSFGRDKIPNYNKPNITKRVKKIRYLSTREESGSSLIKELTGRNSEVLVDPTLIITKDEWNKEFALKEESDEKYMLAYFLDEPSERTKRIIKTLSTERALKVITIPYTFLSSISDEFVSAGPIEFLRLIYNAKFVCTDSFHGTAFSLNFGVPFFTFERNYGAAGSQSSRLLSILTKADLLYLYEPEALDMHELDYENITKVLSKERDKSYNYLKTAIHEIIQA